MGGRQRALTVWLLCCVAVACLPTGSLVVRATEPILTDEQRQTLGRAKTIYVDVAASTWMPRGRTLSDVGPSLRTKLASAGFTVVRNQTDRHELTLKVLYREAQGRQYRIDTYGTDITCVVQLEHAGIGPLLDLTIQESSTYPETGTPPYLEALEKFVVNPYFYLLGDLVKGRVTSGLDTTGALIEGLERLAEHEPVKSDPLKGEYLMSSDEVMFYTSARENVIQELGRLKDLRAVPILTKLLRHSDPRVRLLSVRALRSIAAVASRSAIERVAQQDKDREVRRAAAAALDGLPGSPQASCAPPGPC
ncbi:MAG: HEAT repeat domain-containing protein [Nitrospiraceae bacterium]